ncbi:MAG: hypothetical protein WKG07_45995 [Hymenobacter sp.]
MLRASQTHDKADLVVLLGSPDPESAEHRRRDGWSSVIRPTQVPWPGPSWASLTLPHARRRGAGRHPRRRLGRPDRGRWPTCSRPAPWRRRWPPSGRRPDPAGETGPLAGRACARERYPGRVGGGARHESFQGAAGGHSSVSA